MISDNVRSNQGNLASGQADNNMEISIRNAYDVLSVSQPFSRRYMSAKTYQ
jgi:hypothetical protein